MTRTDQAFIEAYQRSVGQARGEAPATDRPAAVRRRVKHGPHVAWRDPTPLTEAIAERMRQAATADTSSKPSLRLRCFDWPTVVTELAARHASQYQNLAPSADIAGRVLGIAGVRQGSGATTTTLAMARCLASERGPVALVDADPAGPGMAEALGVIEIPHGIESTIEAEADHISLAIASSNNAADPNALPAMIGERNALTLVDFGAALDHQTAWSSGVLPALIDSLKPAGVLLVRTGSDLSGAVAAAQRVVESAGVAALGLVENRTLNPAD